MALAAAVRCSAASMSGALLASSTPTRILQVRCIMTKVMLDKVYQRPKPYPYKEKKYDFFRALLDSTPHRFNENTKVIVVDGLPAVGKAKFAQEVAKELDMFYFPNADMDHILVDHYGFDWRKLDPQLPLSCRSFDVNDFLREPGHRNATSFQMSMMQIRLLNYIDALAHILSTGQGVVMNRSVYSDSVYMEVMHKFGFLAPGFKEYYYKSRTSGSCEIMHPHLVIYLDTDIEAALDKIKKRDREPERNSPFYRHEILSYMREVYKQQYLKEMSDHSELLVYDWTEEGEADVVVEDICAIDFDKYTKYDSRMKDWRIHKKWDWNLKRMMMSVGKQQQIQWTEVTQLHIPELHISGDDMAIAKPIFDSVPGSRYLPGFNSDRGDKWLFKY